MHLVPPVPFFYYALPINFHCDYTLSKLTPVSFPVRVYLRTKYTIFGFDIYYKQSVIRHKINPSKTSATFVFTKARSLFAALQKLRDPEAC